MNTLKLNQVFKAWLATVVVGLGGLLFAYVAVHQSIRQGANQPQQQLAEDMARSLNRGADPKAILTSAALVDASESFAPFVIVTDEDRNILANNADLGDLPLPPSGSFAAADKGLNRFSWEPKSGVRHAAVIVPFQSHQSGYILAAKSLRPSEAIVEKISHLALLAVAGVILVPTVIFFLL